MPHSCTAHADQECCISQTPGSCAKYGKYYDLTLYTDHIRVKAIKLKKQTFPKRQ